MVGWWIVGEAEATQVEGAIRGDCGDGRERTDANTEILPTFESNPASRSVPYSGGFQAAGR